MALPRSSEKKPLVETGVTIDPRSAMVIAEGMKISFRGRIWLEKRIESATREERQP